MRKTILLIALPLTALLAIDFTMTKEGLFAETTVEPPAPTPVTVPTPGTDPKVDNPYLEPVNLPECDPYDPEVQFIETKEDWKTINSSSKRIFCVSTGDYSSLGSIKLTASGTAAKRRYILLNNGNNTHPGKLLTNELAIFMLKFSGASYWTIDRQSITHKDGKTVDITNGSSHNILNRMYTYDVATSVNFRHLSHNNTVQNSRFVEGRDPGYDGPVAVQIFAYGIKEAEVHNTKVINNEFYNVNDGFQIVRFSVNGHTTPYQDVNAEGTIVDSNQFHKDIPYMENAMDLKAGSDNPNNPVIISNNIMWGYRVHPDYVKGSYGPGKTAVVVHFDVKNTQFINNIIFDSDEGIRAASGGPATGFRRAFIDSTIEDNIFYQCGGNGKHATWISHNNDLHMNNNSYVDSQHAEGYLYQNTGTFYDNKVALPYGGNLTFDIHNDYPNSSSFQEGIDTMQKTSDAIWDDFTFTWGKFTNNPQPITLPKVMAPNMEFPKWN